MNYERRQKLAAHLFATDENGNLHERYDKINPREASPLVLAYIGDAYYHLFVRRRLLSFDQTNIALLHDVAAKLVSAAWQAKVYHHLAAELTDEEREIFRRGRNTKSHVPKSSSVADYRISTGLETLLGTLYLENQTDRLRELAEAAFQFMARELMEEQATKFFVTVAREE